MTLTLIGIGFMLIAAIFDRGIIFPVVHCTIFVEVLRLSYIATREAHIEHIVRKSELHRANQQILAMKPFSTIGKLTAQFVHDLGNELTIFNGFFMLIKQHFFRDAEEPVEEEFVNRAESSIDRLKDMFDDFKNNAIQTKKSYSQEKIKLGMLGLELEKMFEPILKDKDITISTEVDFRTQNVMVPKNAMTRVISNMVKNSIEALEELAPQERLIKVKAKSNYEGLTITVTDSGKGIPYDIASKIMDPMFTTKDRKGGTGLGLASCKAIVEDLSGTIKLDSAAKNTKFQIFLPFGPYIFRTSEANHTQAAK